jgi:hypothetical protein
VKSSNTTSSPPPKAASSTSVFNIVADPWQHYFLANRRKLPASGADHTEFGRFVEPKDFELVRALAISVWRVTNPFVEAINLWVEIGRRRRRLRALGCLQSRPEGVF